MTTTITLHVGGRYMAVVKQDGAKEPVEVHGDYEGSPNPGGNRSFNLGHGSLSNKFVISEYSVPTDAEKAAQQSKADAETGVSLIAGTATGEVKDQSNG